MNKHTGKFWYYYGNRLHINNLYDLTILSKRAKSKRFGIIHLRIINMFEELVKKKAKEILTKFPDFLERAEKIAKEFPK